ncbi:hypothetical protein JW992_11960 [candidate division KSB1 bacterium]|nr:hypothetical protein [candidate division KSB1 bacterium]
MFKRSFSAAALVLLLAAALVAGEATVYVTTLSTSYTHTGQKHSQSGLFYRSTADTVWSFSGRPNNRVYNMDRFEPAGGRILGLATHAGVQMSWDGGATWKVTSDWRMTEVSGIRFHPSDSAIVYAASPYGFYKSTDGGHSWKQQNNGLETVDATFISSMFLDSRNPDMINISTEDGVYRSTDAGQSWIRQGLNVRNIRTLVQHPHNPSIFFAGTENNGIYRSLDDGRHWQKCDTGILHPTFYTIAFDPSQPETLYAGGFQTGVYKSVNGGKSWKHDFRGLDVLDIHALAVDPHNSDRIYAGTVTNGVYLSEDAGKTWEFIGIDSGYVWGLTIKSNKE